MLARLKNGNESCKLKAYKKIIDGLIFPAPREIPITFTERRAGQSKITGSIATETLKMVWKLRFGK